MSLAECVEILRIMRENNERKSNEVLDLWEHTISHKLDKLNKDKHLILEQTCIAALDCQDIATAERCVKILDKDFPNSLRVKKYKAMIYEALQDYDTATKILNSILQSDEMNSAARKRKIAILKATGKTAECIKELTEYLKMYMADNEAWQELSELYISEQDFSKAAFCVEELILHNPHNHLLHQRYADIKYTQGGPENLDLAKAYYSQALKLSPNNMRALYGLYLVSSAIAGSSKSSAQKKKEAGKLAELTLKDIQNRYNKASKIEDLQTRLSALEL